jgi:transglutaminase-like putative cysteine protease
MVMRCIQRRVGAVAALGLLVGCGVALLIGAGWSAEPRLPEETPKERTFLFTYAATVTGLAPGQIARVWAPVPPTNQDQRVERVQQELPGRPHVGRDPKYGNQIVFFESPAAVDGTVRLSLVYRVARREVTEEATHRPAALADAEYLKPDALVPIGGKPLELLKGKALPQDQVKLARVLYDTVDHHMEYRKDGPGWGRGDASWACDSGFGNCTDFHSLFISLARTKHIPSQFEIGFPIPEPRGRGDVAGYHCWAKFKPQGHGWIPVDISEANKAPSTRDYFFGHLCENRIAFSTGRDLELVPKQAGPPVNFLIYPYVEVDGKPYPAEKVLKHFRYEDVQEHD